MTAPILWLASYPRSGNTFFRTILYQCFSIRSGSFYPRDVSPALAPLVGHVERDETGNLQFGRFELQAMKTHEPPSDHAPAIYVVRDGRPVVVSMWEFYQRSVPLADIIRGSKFGTWSQHLRAWRPVTRPQTLLIRYEEMTADPKSAIDAVGEFLKREPVRYSIPSRQEIAALDGQWVRAPSDWRNHLHGAELELFDQINGQAMRTYRYY
jgi:hypothetical protein